MSIYKLSCNQQNYLKTLTKLQLLLLVLPLPLTLLLYIWASMDHECELSTSFIM